MTPKKIDRNFYRSLMSEIDFLKQEGIFSEETVERIKNTYEISPSKQRDVKNTLFITLVAFGVLTLGFAAFLVLRHNWPYLSPTVKTIIAMGALAGVYLGSFILRCLDRKIISEMFLFAGAILFGVNIWQIAQIYQYPLDFSEGIWIWGIGVFLLALFSRYPVFHYFALAIFMIGMFQSPKTSVFSLELLKVSGIALLFTLGYYWSVCRRFSSVSVLYLIFLTVWQLRLFIIYHPGSISITLYQIVILGGLFWFIGTHIAKRSAVIVTAKNLGWMLVFFGIALLTQSSFHYLHRNYDVFSSMMIPDIVLGLMFCFCMSAAWNQKRQSGQKIFNWKHLFSPAGIAFLILPVFLLLFCQLSNHPIQNLLEKGSSAPFGSQPHRALFFLRYSGYSSILMFGLAWYFILTGIKGKPHYYWLGSLYFILWLILNYFDTFGIVHGALPTAGFFTVVAILLFLAAYLSTKIKKEPDAEVSTENLPKSELASEPVSPLTTNSEPDKKERTANAPENQTVSSALYAGTVFTIFLQFACLFLFIITQTVMFWGGTRITVETQPVDPFDMFRGDYVRLSYPFSSVHSVPNNLDDSKSIVYVLLKRDPADNLWKPHTMSSQKPTANGGIVLRGRRSKRNGLITYGIETFFLQEGRGRQIEDAMARRSTGKKAVVDLLVAHNGRAQVENVRIIDVPKTEALNENQPVETIQESPSDAESRTRDQPQ